MVVDARANAEWSLDFMSDALYHGRRFRTLNVLDEGVRDALDIVIDTSIPGARVVRTLERLIEWRGKPRAIRVDNGPEYTSYVFTEWCEKQGIKLNYIQPGKPNQNAYIERFNRSYRTEVLDTWLFRDLDEVREITWAWMLEYNEERDHDSLGGMTPAEALKRARSSTFEWST